MTITVQVHYERTISLGNYENEKIGVTLAPDPNHLDQPGEAPAALLKAARKLVGTHTTAYLRKQREGGEE